MHECTKINWKPNRKYRIEKKKKEEKREETKKCNEVRSFL